MNAFMHTFIGIILYIITLNFILKHPQWRFLKKPENNLFMRIISFFDK